MNKLKRFFKTLWDVFDPILELAIYVTIAFVISKIVNISFMWAIAIVFSYFMLNVIRILAEVIRDHYKK